MTRATRNPESLYQLRVVMDRFDTKDILEALREMQVAHTHLETARTVLLAERKGLKALLHAESPLTESQTVVATFLVPAILGKEAVNFLTLRLGIDAPGRGSITARRVDRLLAAEGLGYGDIRVPPSEPRIITEGLAGISCIVVKGAGNEVATIGLSTGTAVPDLSYGIGTGLRNRMGTWRILVPAEKEIANLVVDEDDAQTVMDMMATAGRLDMPGKGFIFSYPVAFGVLETKFQVGDTRQAASLEQLIYAVDELKGSTGWRRKGLGSSTATEGGRKYLSSLVDLTLTCNEGYCELLTKASMDAGAGGATTLRPRYVPIAEEASNISPAREMSIMTVGESMVDRILEALLDKGILDPAVSGEVLTSPVHRAFTYLGK